MYFLKQGVVQIVLKEFNNFQFIRIEPGYYFGEVDLLFGETHKYTHLAHSDVELLALSKKDFNRIFFHEFREIGSELYKNALKRKVRYDKRYKEAFDYCKSINYLFKFLSIIIIEFNNLKFLFILSF